AQGGDQADLRYLRGRARFDQKKWSEAVTDFDVVVQRAPDEARALFYRGRALNRMERYQAALNDLDKAPDVSGDATLPYERALAHYYLEAYAPAHEVLNEVLTRDANHPAAWQLRADICYAEGRADAAETAYGKVIELDGENEQALRRRGTLRNQRGDWAGARADFGQAIALKPTRDSHFGRAWAAYQDEYYDVAMQDFDAVLKLAPKDTAALFYRGDISLTLERGREAITFLDRLLEQEPAHHPALVRRASARALQSDHAGAIEDYSAALDLQPGDGRLHYRRAVARLESEDYEGALADLDQVVTLMPDEAEAYSGRANVKLRVEDYDGACSDWQESLKRGNLAAKAMLRQYCP
ncbi:MAG: tetratricopeptide repeat protein, partial [Catalinimonas sp.]